MNKQIVRYYWTALCLILGIAYMVGNTSVDYRINAQYTPTPDPNACTCTYTCTGNCLATVKCHKPIDNSSCGITPNVSNLSCCAVPTGTTACNALTCHNTCGLGGCPGGCGNVDDCGGVSCGSCSGGPTPTPSGGGGTTCTPNCNAQACRANTCNNQTCQGTCGEFCYGTLPSSSPAIPVLGSPTTGTNVPVGTVTLGWGTPSDWGTCPGTETFNLCVSTSSSSPCTTGVAINGLPSTQLSYDYTFSTPGTYYWVVAADNGTGNPVTYSATNTLIINALPTLSAVTLYNSHSILVPWDVGVGISGKSHIQNNLFRTDSSPRTVIYSFDIADANGWADITSAQMSWNGQVSNLTIGGVTATTARATTTINYPSSANSNGLYPIMLKMNDNGGSTGWFDTGRKKTGENRDQASVKKEAGSSG
jgi:hypothetical protein